MKTLKLTSSDSASQIILPIGTTIGGTFRTLSLIGTGGMAAVYLVEQTSLKREFALKVLAPGLVNKKNWQRFQAEAKTMASLNHPSFVKVYDLGIHEDKVPFYTMDKVEGQTLEEILAKTGPIDLERALDIFIEVLNGLAYAHRNGIIHRDIKPANIMYCTAGSNSTIKILDFGISKVIGSTASKNQSMTMAGDIFGSPYYMSPEQCIGAKVDARSDIYSIGCALFETLTGFVPFEGRSQLETIMMHQEDNPPLLSEIMPKKTFTTSLDAILSTCLAKLPQNRYQSAKELAIDLERIKEGKDIQASSPAFAQLKNLKKEDKEEKSERIETQKTFLEREGIPRTLLNSIRSKKLTITTLIMILPIVAGIFLNLRLAANLFPVSTWKKEDSSQIGNKIAKTEAAGRPQNFSTEQLKNAQTCYSQIIDGGRSIEFSFPKDQSIGQIGIAGKRSKMQNAQGKVWFLRQSAIKFCPNGYAFSHPEMFDSFRPEDLFSLTLNNEIYHNHDFRESMPSICKLNGIRELDIKGTAIGDDQIVHLNKLRNLHTLKIENTKITGTGIAYLARLKELKCLNFGSNKDLHKMLVAMQGSDKINILSLNSSERALTESDAELIASCKSIKQLELDGSVTTDKVLHILSSMPNLEHISLRDCILSRQSIEDLKNKHPRRKIEVTLSETAFPGYEKL
jgi:serine/threonine protein kinase